MAQDFINNHADKITPDVLVDAAASKLSEQAWQTLKNIPTSDCFGVATQDQKLDELIKIMKQEEDRDCFGLSKGNIEPKAENLAKVLDFAADKAVESVLKGQSPKLDAGQIALKNMDLLLKIIQLIPPKTYEAGELKRIISPLAQKYLDRETADIITNIKSLHKDGNHIELNFDREVSLPVSQKIPGTLNLVKLGSVKVSDLSFDVNSQNGNQCVENIKGLKLHYSTPIGHGFDGEVKSVKVGRSENGDIKYEARVTQESRVGAALGEPKEITEELRIDPNGHLVIAKKLEQGK